MEGQEDLKQEKRIEPKIRASRDGKWLIMRVQEIEQPIILAVNYLKAIIENTEKKKAQAAANAEQIKN